MTDLAKETSAPSLEAYQGVEGDGVPKRRFYSDSTAVDPDWDCAPGDTARAPPAYHIQLGIHLSDGLDGGAFVGIKSLFVQPWYPFYLKEGEMAVWG